MVCWPSSQIIGGVRLAPWLPSSYAYETVSKYPKEDQGERRDLRNGDKFQIPRSDCLRGTF